MNNIEIPRRRFLGAGAATMVAGPLALSLPGSNAQAQAESPPTASSDDSDAPFRYCLNMSTIRGMQLDLVQEIEVAAAAGYDAIEPWMGKIDAHIQNGGKLKDLNQRIADHGMTVESAIGFAQWIVDDDALRKRGLETAKRDMDHLAQIGAKRIAAPPAGANDAPVIDLFTVAERYRALLELGSEMGVVPQIELWGFSKNLSRLGEVVFVATEASHPDACILPDVYHIFRGGSRFEGLGLLDGDAVQVFHINDYPAEPPREQLNDSDRVYPGDGVAPLSDILRMLRDAGGQTVLSLELFNKTYWKQPADVVARRGLESMKAAVAAIS